MAKKSLQFSLIITGISLLLLNFCSKTPDLDFLSIDVDEIAETSVKISWKVSEDSYSSVQIAITNESDPSVTADPVAIDGNTYTAVTIEGLTGLTDYSYKITLLDDKSKIVLESNKKEFSTLYTKENIEFTTQDNFILQGRLNYLSSWSEKVPGIIMMHGLGSLGSPWYDTDLMKMLIKEGYACMAFYFRGHGSSDAYPRDSIRTIPGAKAIGDDMLAAMSFTKNHERIDPENLGLIGGSMGAAMAVIGNSFPEVQTSVALSAPNNELLIYAVPDLVLQLASIYYITAESDFLADYDFPSAAQELYERTSEPKKIWILPNSQAHSADILTYVGANDSIVSWFKEQLPSPVAN